jgi:hypothetical protein
MRQTFDTSASVIFPKQTHSCLFHTLSGKDDLLDESKRNTNRNKLDNHIHFQQWVWIVKYLSYCECEINLQSLKELLRERWAFSVIWNDTGTSYLVVIVRCYSQDYNNNFQLYPQFPVRQPNCRIRGQNEGEIDLKRFRCVWNKVTPHISKP